MLGNAFGEITERLRRVTVQVLGGGNYRGSGIVWTKSGQVVTNAHVLRDSNAQVELWNGRKVAARVLRRDARRDLAALQVDALQVDAHDLSAAVPGDSGALRPGELVIAVGSPFGFIGAVSTGVVHSVGRLDGFSSRTFVVSDVRLAPGNSGGPLANAQGQVIGVNTMIAGRMAIAIPSNSVGQFLSAPSTDEGYLGVTVRPVQIGLLILQIDTDSPAARASLLPGDLLIGAGGRPIRSAEDLEDALYSSDGRLRIEFHRGGSKQSRTVVAQIAKEPVRAA